MSSEIWNVDKGRLLATMEGHKAKVRDVTCCSATGAVVSGSDDSTMILWNLGRRCSSKVIRESRIRQFRKFFFRWSPAGVRLR